MEFCACRRVLLGATVLSSVAAVALAEAQPLRDDGNMQHLLQVAKQAVLCLLMIGMAHPHPLLLEIMPAWSLELL